MPVIRFIIPIACLLAVSSAATAQIEVAPPPHPTLDNVVKEYVRLGLPVPPKDAELVRIDKYIDYDLSGLDEAERRTWSDSRYVLAYRFPDPTRTNTWSYLVIGFRSGGLDPYPKPVHAGVEVVKPDPAMLERSESRYVIAQFAVFCKLRGEDELARKLYSAAVTHEADDAPLDLPAHYREVAWYGWRDKLKKRDSDRGEILKGLKRVADGFESDEEGQGIGDGLIAALEATVGFRRQAKPGTAEALIDDLTEHWTAYNMGDPMGLWPGTPGQEAYWKLVAMGFDAVPALIDHLEDDRLSRSRYNVLVNNFHGYNLTVGHLCSDILCGLSCDQIGGGYWPIRGDRYDPDEARKWFAAARKVGEEKWLLDHSVPAKEEKPQGLVPKADPSIRMIHIIGARYPKHLLKLHRDALNNKSHCFEAVAHSALPRKEKVELLNEGIRDESKRMWSAAMYGLYAADHDLHRKALLAYLRRLDRGTRDPGNPGKYGTALEAVVDHVELACDPGCWEAFIAAIKRMPPDDRSSRLHELVWTEYFNEAAKKEHRADHLRVLASFLTDEANCADGTPVRDDAAALIANITGLRVIRDEHDLVKLDARTGPITRWLLRARASVAAEREVYRLRKP